MAVAAYFVLLIAIFALAAIVAIATRGERTHPVLDADPDWDWDEEMPSFNPKNSAIPDRSISSAGLGHAPHQPL